MGSDSGRDSDSERERDRAQDYEPSSGSDFVEDDDSDTGLSKRKKKSTPAANKSSKKSKMAARDTAAKEEEEVVGKNQDGESFFALGPKRRITVRQWKGKPMVDIREFWTDSKDGQDKPGKKGISLSLDQWNTLKSLMPSIDALLH